MKQPDMKKEMAAWKIMLASGNNVRLNSFIAIIFLLDAACFLLVCLKRLCQYENTFPYYPVCTSTIMMTVCYSFFCRMFFNRTSPCFVKTLPFSKSILTTKLSLLFESINTVFLLIVIVGSFVCLGKGYDSRFFYLVIIFFLFVYLSVSIMLPLSARFFNNEKRIFFMLALQLLPLVLICFLANPIADLFEPLSLHGLTMMAGVAGAVVVVSCTANYLMFRMAYKRR